ncbi:MAG TPA: transposase [Planctomycetota bacterium]|nr:transposase [Planctomycetota bacterium]
MVPGNPHLVAHRARAARRLFTCEADYRLYLVLLASEARRFRTEILAYALLPDHVHLIVVPADERALATAVGRAHALYARAVNRAARRPRAWAPRFESCPLGKELLPDAICHVETRPVRARLVRCPWRWPWSSAAAHVGLGDPAGLLDLKPLKWWIGKRWKEWLRDGIEPRTELRFLRHTRRGWPVAPEDRLRDWERWLRRPLRPRPVGRPRKPPPVRQPPIPFW